MAEKRIRFDLDYHYDRDQASDCRSRFGSYLNSRSRTFQSIIDDDREDPSVDFTAAVWKIATGPVMVPGFVRFPHRVLAASVTRSDWDGEALIDVTLRTPPAQVLWNVSTPGGRYFRDWPVDWTGHYTGISEKDVAESPFLVTSAQVLIPVPAGTLPHITNIPVSGPTLLAQATECLEVAVAVLNQQLGPILDRLGVIE